MAGATLPEFPKGREFEEYVAAVFQAAGYFLERDITEREEIEILQLDSISTDYDNKPPIIRLIEAKSGDWGFKDIFKIKGWMTYLDIEHGTLITSMDRDRFESYQNKSKKMGIDLIFIDDPSNFNDTIAGRVEALYDSYGRNRTLAACCGQEMLGKEFSPEGEQIPQSIFRDTFYDCKYNEIQSACMVEQYARLTLLKAVVDNLCYKSP